MPRRAPSKRKPPACPDRICAMTSALKHVHSTDENHKVTTLELFFDLVFVFAITQVTQLMANDPTGRGALRGLVLLGLLWFAWASFAWLGNSAKADEGLLRLCLVGAVMAMFAVALAVPESFGDHPGGLDAPLLLAISYAAVRMAHLVVYLVVAVDDEGLRHQLHRTLIPVAISGVLLIAGAVAPHQTIWWVGAVVVDYAGIYLAGASGWRLPGPAHFAERHGLIVLIAIGESIVSIGVGVSGTPVTTAILVASLAGLAVAVCLWWLYFDVVALVAERVLTELPPERRPLLARDSYTYLHFPMVAGIVFLSLGMKKVLGEVAKGHLSEALTGMPLLSLYGGTIAYLLAHIGFRLRNVGSLSRTRATTSVVLLASIPVVAQVPAMVALGWLALVMVVLVAFEAWRYAVARARIRHAE
jgi:low temperature requirement protein LtrA